MEEPPRIRVPKPTGDSYNPDRPLNKNDLLKAQVKRFREVEKELPREHRAPLRPKSIKTEGQAAEYIGHITRKLHELEKRKPR